MPFGPDTPATSLKQGEIRLWQKRIPRNQTNARPLRFRREKETRRRAKEGALKVLQAENARQYVFYYTVLKCSIALNNALLPTQGECMSPRWRHISKRGGTSNLSALPPALHTTDLPAPPALQARQAEEARQRSKSKRTSGGFVVTFNK